MPDSIKYKELMLRLREQLELVKKPIGLPVHPNVLAALNLVADIFNEVPAPEPVDEPLDLSEVIAALKQLKADLLKNTTDDLADKESLNNLLSQLAELESRVAALPAEVVQMIADALRPLNDGIIQIDQRENGRHTEVLQKITELEERIRAHGITESEAQVLIDTNLAPIKVELLALNNKDTDFDNAVKLLEQRLEQLATLVEEKLTAAQAQTLIDASLQPLKQSDEALTSSIAGLDTRVNTLENKEDSGVSEDRAREIAVEVLSETKTNLQGLLDQNLDDRIKNLLTRVELLEQAPPIERISEAEVRRIIGEEIQKIKTELSTIINAKADKTELEPKADKTALTALETALDGKIALKADKTEVAQKADKNELEPKADKAALSALETDLNGKIALKANQTEVDKKAEKTELDSKADKTALAALESDLNGKIALKANQSEVDEKAEKTELEPKADKTALAALETDLNGKIALKANQSDVDKKAEKTELDSKADKTALTALETNLNDKLALKADKIELEQKANKTELVPKADKTALTALETDLNGKLALKADKTELEPKADKTALADLETDLDAKLELKANKSTLTGIETDINGKLALKADKTALTALETDLNGKLARKADKMDISRIDQGIEGLREEWMHEGQNSPDVRLARLCLNGWGIVGGLEIHSNEKDYLTITPGIGVTPTGALVIEPGLESVEEEDEEEVQSKSKSHAHSSKKGHKSSAKVKPESPCNPPKPANLVFSHYQVYAKADEYVFFSKPGTEAYYEVWELLQPSDDLPDDARPLTPQTEAEYELPFISDKIILLLPVAQERHYLLMRRQDVLEKLCCLPHQCKSESDNNADYLYEDSYSPEDDYVSDDEVWACLHPADRLPEIPLFRFGYFTAEECAPEELDVTDFPNLSSINDFYQTWRPIIEDAIGRLEKATQKLIKLYHPTLFPLVHKKTFREKLSELSEKWTLFTVSNDPPKTLADEMGTKYYAQYFYDWLRDLIAAYHELRWELIALMNDLRPYSYGTLATQHRHLLLGPAQQPDSNGLDAPLRDHFHQAPIYNSNAARLETCRLYYRRLFQIIDGFYLENYAPNGQMPGYCSQEDEDGMLVEHKPDFDRLRITPGKRYIYPLSEQTIPFYYPLIDHPQSLQQYWNYRRAKNRSVDRILSYHATDFPQDFPTYSNRKEVIRPLHYSLDAHDFYRIEGFIGKSKVRIYPKISETEPPAYDVFDALQYLVRKHNLDFQVLKINVSELQKPQGGASAPYSIGSEKAQSFRLDLLGAEHLAGVPKGGTFILVYEVETNTDLKKKSKANAGVSATQQHRYIADFSLPYRCCAESNAPSTQPDVSAINSELRSLRQELNQRLTEMEKKIQALEAKLAKSISDSKEQVTVILKSEIEQQSVQFQTKLDREIKELKSEAEDTRKKIDVLTVKVDTRP